MCALKKQRDRKEEAQHDEFQTDSSVTIPVEIFDWLMAGNSESKTARLPVIPMISSVSFHREPVNIRQGRDQVMRSNSHLWQRVTRTMNECGNR